jgi:uncharacterized protein
MARELFHEAVREGRTDVAAALLEGEPELSSSRDAQGIHPVLVALYRGHDEMVELLLARGADLGACEAAAVGDATRLEELLRGSPDLVDARSSDGWTPLHLAAFFGRAEAARVLLDAGALVGSWSDNATRNNPLHAALAGRAEPRLVELLLERGADLNAAGGGGYTPLHLAASRGDVQNIEVLLRHGARSAPSESGHTPREIALDRGHAAAADRLREVD